MPCWLVFGNEFTYMICSMTYDTVMCVLSMWGGSSLCWPLSHSVVSWDRYDVLAICMILHVTLYKIVAIQGYAVEYLFDWSITI